MGNQLFKPGDVVKKAGGPGMMLSLVAFLILLVFVASCSQKRTPLDSAISEVDRQRSALLKYYELNGHFPQRLGDIDPTLENHRDFGNGGWMYSARKDSYGLVRQLPGLVGDGIWFEFDTEDKEGSGWFLSSEQGGNTKLKEFGLSEDEEAFFESREKKGITTVHPHVCPPIDGPQSITNSDPSGIPNNPTTLGKSQK